MKLKDGPSRNIEDRTAEDSYEVEADEVMAREARARRWAEYLGREHLRGERWFQRHPAHRNILLDVLRKKLDPRNYPPGGVRG